jgi:hypothetical protein
LQRKGAKVLTAATKIPFPPLATINGRHFVDRSDFEHYKLALLAAAYGHSAQSQPPTPAPQFRELVPLKKAAEELGVCRRTLGNRIKASAK